MHIKVIKYKVQSVDYKPGTGSDYSQSEQIKIKLVGFEMYNDDGRGGLNLFGDSLSSQTGFTLDLAPAFFESLTGLAFSSQEEDLKLIKKSLEGKVVDIKLDLKQKVFEFKWD